MKTRVLSLVIALLLSLAGGAFAPFAAAPQAGGAGTASVADAAMAHCDHMAHQAPAAQSPAQHAGHASHDGIPQASLMQGHSCCLGLSLGLVQPAVALPALQVAESHPHAIQLAPDLGLSYGIFKPPRNRA